MMGIPYTGSGVSACIRAADKVLAKHAMRDAGIPTPDFYAFNETAFKELGAAQALPEIEERLHFPIVVKPAGQGSALGIKFARTAGRRPVGAGRGVLLRPQGAARAPRARARPGRLDPRRGRVADARCRSSRRSRAQEDFYDFEARYEIGRTDSCAPRCSTRRSPPGPPTSPSRSTRCSAAPASAAST